MAKVSLVRVPSLFAGGSLTLSATPPIGLAYLASNLRIDGHDVKVIDSVGEALEQVHYFGNKNFYVNGLTIEEIIRRIPRDTMYIGISFPFSHEWPLARKICFTIKEKFPDSVLIGGGEHATAMPEFCMENCPAIDYIILGEGETTLRELITALETSSYIMNVTGLALRDERDNVITTERRKRIKIVDDIMPPAWDLLPLENYLIGGYSFGVNIGRTIPIMASRGCPYQCTFCSNLQMWTSRWISRSPLKVVDEMEDYIKRYSIENFDFYDLTAIVKKEWIMEFCNLLAERKLRITWQLPSGTRSEALDNEVTKLLYESGCRNISYAPESGSPETLKRIKKRINLDRMVSSMKSSINNKINIKANIIVGFPGEKIRNILETYRFILKMATVGVNDVSVWTFSAYPGSEIFNYLQREGGMPEVTDEYFLSLLSYSDLRNVVSWNEYFPSNILKYIRLIGLLLFYSANYILRPIRFIRTIRNIISKKPQSRLEMILEKAVYRHKKKHK
jgi:radical SAM superfamily enzyme YgiQ (UPF0313 family)